MFVPVPQVEISVIIEFDIRVSSRYHVDPLIWGSKWFAHLNANVHKHRGRTWLQDSKCYRSRDLKAWQTIFQISYINITWTLSSDDEIDELIWMPGSTNMGVGLDFMRLALTGAKLWRCDKLFSGQTDTHTHTQTDRHTHTHTHTDTTTRINMVSWSFRSGTIINMGIGLGFMFLSVPQVDIEIMSVSQWPWPLTLKRINPSDAQ